MNERLDARDEGLRFFGKVTASLSHEIRNVLATIYENAGLVEDLILASEKGRPLDPNRIKDLAGRLKAQVRRGRDVADNMNRFAHSGDEPTRQVDVGETLVLVASLARRIASMKGVALETEHVGEPVMIRTNPFLLENLLWACLDFAMNAGAASGTLRLKSEAGKDGAVIRFQGLSNGQGSSEMIFPDTKEKILGNEMGAELKLDRESGEIVLVVPRGK